MILMMKNSYFMSGVYVCRSGACGACALLIAPMPEKVLSPPISPSPEVGHVVGHH